MVMETLYSPKDLGSQDGCQSGLLRSSYLSQLLAPHAPHDAAVLLQVTSPREPRSSALNCKSPKLPSQHRTSSLPLLPVKSISKVPTTSPVQEQPHAEPLPHKITFHQYETNPAEPMPSTELSSPHDQLSCQPCHAPPENLCQSFCDITELVPQIQAAIDAEKALGHVVDNSQDPASLARLQAKVASLLQGYAAQCVAAHALQHQQLEAATEQGIARAGSGATGSVSIKPARSADLDKHVFFNEHHYVRNLVAGNDDFELMVVCWQPGQVSRVHNHGSSHCWLVVLEGEMEEVQYGMPGQHAAAAGQQCSADASSEEVCPALTQLKTTCLKVGDLGYISDKLALHTVGNSSRSYCTGSSTCSSTGCSACRGGVTLHLYAPPIRRVRLYEPEAGKVVERTPGFYSVGGQRV